MQAFIPTKDYISISPCLVPPPQLKVLSAVFGSVKAYTLSSLCTWLSFHLSENLVFLYISAHPSKTHGDESRPELVLRLTLSSLAVSVLHIDPLPPPDATPSPLGPMAAHFFSMVGPGQLDPAAFLQSRTVFNQACPHDHLRCIFFFINSCCVRLHLMSC